jgi:SPP1 gp7 family putative phage head morphogenesis protein
MARTPQDYWEKRQTELMKRLEKQSEGTIQRLVTAYNKSKDNIQKEIQKIFGKYVVDGKLTFKEAKELLNTRETKEFYDNLLKQINSIDDVDVRRKLLAKYNAPAYAYRISRYQALQENIDIELKKLVQEECVISKKHYVDIINEGYYRSIFNVQKGIGIGFNFSQLDNRTINLILNENWYKSENFSQRIWKNNNKLANYLKSNFLVDNIAGKSIQRMASALDDAMNIGKYNAVRLLRTETNHFANEAEMLSYKELDIEKYRFIATLDNVTCKHCAELDNKIFYLKDKQPR